MAVYTWNWHQWAEADGVQYDPSAATSHGGGWGDYEDTLFTDYRRCASVAPPAYVWAANQPGQSSGCEQWPAHCDYRPGPLGQWLGPTP